MPIDFNSMSLWMLGAIFAAAALVVWLAGTRLVGLVDGVSTKTGLGQAFTGMLLLGGITSLPELAAVSNSAAVGNAPLAVNNMLGTASMNLGHRCLRGTTPTIPGSPMRPEGLAKSRGDAADGEPAWLHCRRRRA